MWECRGYCGGCCLLGVFLENTTNIETGALRRGSKGLEVV